MPGNHQPLASRLDPAPGTSLAQLKTQQLARDEEERIRLRRLKGTLILIQQLLLEQGFLQSLQTLQQESGLSLTQWGPADNIDLLGVIAEFEEFYALKHQRRPKLFRAAEETASAAHAHLLHREKDRLPGRRRLPGTETPAPPTSTSLNRTYSNGSATTTTTINNNNMINTDNAKNSLIHALDTKGNINNNNNNNNIGSSGKLPRGGRAGGGNPSTPPTNGSAATKDASGTPGAAPPPLPPTGISLQGVKLAPSPPNPSVNYLNCLKHLPPPHASDAGVGEPDDLAGWRGAGAGLLKPPPVFPTSELRELAQTILRDVVEVDPGVRWGDIAALDEAKSLLREAVVLPMRYPALFEGLVRPWRGILLFGPPGTGKTLLAKALATEGRTTFFNISASSVVSKWRGDSEKLIRMLFDLAVHFAPSTIFIDEIDSLATARGGGGGGHFGAHLPAATATVEHEGSRRMKTELLVQMDGLAKRPAGAVVFVLAASNTPWDLDPAMLRRLEKRILVPLPGPDARRVILRQRLAAHVQDAEAFNWEKCVGLTNGLSGADLDVLCREAMMRPIRALLTKLESAERGLGRLPSEPLVRPKTTLADIEASVACTCPSVRAEDLARYDAWAKQYGSGMST